jgi:hypothetical protein
VVNAVSSKVSGIELTIEGEPSDQLNFNLP